MKRMRFGAEFGRHFEGILLLKTDLWCVSNVIDQLFNHLSQLIKHLIKHFGVSLEGSNARPINPTVGCLHKTIHNGTIYANYRDENTVRRGVWRHSCCQIQTPYSSYNWCVLTRTRTSFNSCGGVWVVHARNRFKRFIKHFRTSVTMFAFRYWKITPNDWPKIGTGHIHVVAWVRSSWNQVFLHIIAKSRLLVPREFQRKKTCVVENVSGRFERVSWNISFFFYSFMATPKTRKSINTDSSHCQKQ